MKEVVQNKEYYYNNTLYSVIKVYKGYVIYYAVLQKDRELVTPLANFLKNFKEI